MKKLFIALSLSLVAIAIMLIVPASSCRRDKGAPTITARNTDDGHSTPLRKGDLIFVGTAPVPAPTGMDRAITAATGSYTHVAIVLSPDTVADATPQHGVARRSIEQLYSEAAGATVTAYRVTTAQWDTATLLTRLLPLIGKDYDLYFLPDNDLYYCSELIQYCYLDRQGQTLFPSAPMNFLAADSTLPIYWQQLFDSLHCPVPQNIPGTNPTTLSTSPHLTRL